jgi:hypothetical protein
MREIAYFAQIELGLHMLQMMLHKINGLVRIVRGDCLDNLGMFIRATIEAIGVTIDGSNQRAAGDQVAHRGEQEIRPCDLSKEKVEAPGKLDDVRGNVFGDGDPFFFHMIAQALDVGFGIGCAKPMYNAALYRAAHKKNISRFVDRRLTHESELQAAAGAQL